MGECIKGVNRTLGDCKASHAEYVASGVKKDKVNQYYNCLESPIDMMSGEDDTWTLALYPPPVLHILLLGGPNDLFRVLKKRYPVQFADFQKRFGFERTEGRGGMYNGVTIRTILKTDRILEDIRSWPRVPDNIREAVVAYLKATWDVYLVSMKQEVDDNHPQIFQAFKERFQAVRKVLTGRDGIKHTVKVHCVTDHMSEYMENCQSTFSWTSDEFIESLHNKLRRFEENHSLAIRKKKNFGSILHQQRLLSSIGLFNYENLGTLFITSFGCVF